MGIVNEFTTVGLNGSVISYYENLGYEIPRRKDKEGRLKIPSGATINVKTTDLSPSSNQIIEAECDCCKKHKKIQYNQYNKNINRNNGLYLCSIDGEHRDFRNGVSYEKIIECIKNYYNKNGRFPKHNEYTKENGFSLT